MKKYILIAFLTAVALKGMANNLNVQVTASTTTTVTFDISWMSSWRMSTAPDNWDAVWLFVKMQDCSSVLKKWEHVNLSTTPSDHTVGNPILEFKTVADKKGVFLQRSGDGFGNIAATSVTLEFDAAIPAGANVQVFGIEMAYIPQASFYVGSTTGNTAASGFPFKVTQITSEAALAANDLKHASNVATTHLAIPAAFPKGYAAFYCMKYEITQKQYMGFLNTLSYIQQRERTINTPSVANTFAFSVTSPFTAPTLRNGIKVKTAGTGAAPAEYAMDLDNDGVWNETNADGLNIAMNYLSQEDLKAYLDWSALRPMTELEYEKVCRGPLASVNIEFIHGTASSVTTLTSLVNGNASNEYANPINANYNSGGTLNYPVRVGAFALPSSSTRTESGAAYYGVLDMGGNVTEQVVRVSSQYCRPVEMFDGSLGDGNLNQHGSANVFAWRGSESLINTKGGSLSLSNDFLRTSYRWGTNYAHVKQSMNLQRVHYFGGRGVRQE